MEGLKFGINAKEVRKVAFAVGFGFTLGKLVAGLVSTGLDAVAANLAKRYANKGNSFAKTVCEHSGISYTDEETESQTEDSKYTTIKMGFHA